jgi:hypothetical protein
VFAAVVGMSGQAWGRLDQLQGDAESTPRAVCLAPGHRRRRESEQSPTGWEPPAHHQETPEPKVV